MNKIDICFKEDDMVPPPKATHKPLTYKDYAWIIGLPVVVISLIPLVAVIGTVLQTAFAILMPLILVGTLGHALFMKLKRRTKKDKVLVE